MVTARALGLLLSDPQRSQAALAGLGAHLGLPSMTDGAGIASSVDGGTLLTRRPGLPPMMTLSGLVGTLKGRTAVVQLRLPTDVRPTSESPHHLGPFRLKGIACAVVGGPQDADHAGALRERLIASLPDFLRRSVLGQSEGEAFFFAVLASLQTRGLLERTPSAEQIALAVREGIAQTDGLPRYVVIANGSSLVVVSQGIPGGFVTMSGIDEEVASGLEPTLADSSLARERLRRFRGIVTVGALDEPLPSSHGSTFRFTNLAETCAVEFGRDFESRH
ncbi:MAG: hypothetical protein ACO3JL_18620, partial [Myxococcota bacterium]